MSVMTGSDPSDEENDQLHVLRDADEIRMEPGDWELIEQLPEGLHFRVPRMLAQLRHALKSGRADFLEQLCETAELATAPPAAPMSMEEMKRAALRAFGDLSDAAPRRRRVVECVGRWLESASAFEGSPVAQEARFLLTKSVLTSIVTEFLNLDYEQALALVKPPRGRTGEVGVGLASRWSFACGAFGDRDQGDSLAKFKQAMKDGSPSRRNRSRAK